MGSLGGKFGFGVGIVTVLILADPVTRFTPGPCFIEGGCSGQERMGVILAAAILLVLAVAAGFITRAVVNRVDRRHK
jgi:hypothetical protein